MLHRGIIECSQSDLGPYYIPINDTSYELSVFCGHLIQKAVLTN